MSSRRELRFGRHGSVSVVTHRRGERLIHWTALFQCLCGTAGLIPPFPGSNPGAPASQSGLCGVISRCGRTADIPEDALGIAAVPDARRKARGKPELLLDAAQQKHARIRRELPAVEPNTQFLACNRWKIERQESIFAHDGCGAP